MTNTPTQTRPEFLTDCLVEEINNRWYVDSVESGNGLYFAKAFVFPGRKYLAVKICDVASKNDAYDARSKGRIFMFIDKNTGEVFKPASLTKPAKGVRYLIHQLAENPHIVDKYGSFLYLR
jgi:hypothetical protein